MSNPTEGTALVNFACEYAKLLAARDAGDAVRHARNSAEGPIVWITGSSFMPPLRGFGRADSVWEASNDGIFGGVSVWDSYEETFKTALANANVYLDSPDDDNALYVVDLARYERRDEDCDERIAEYESLSDEWRPIEREAEFYADIKRAPGDIDYAVPLLAEEGDFLGAAHVATQIVHRMRRESYADPQVLKVYAKSELPRSET